MYWMHRVRRLDLSTTALMSDVCSMRYRPHRYHHADPTAAGASFACTRNLSIFAGSRLSRQSYTSSASTSVRGWSGKPGTFAELSISALSRVPPRYENICACAVCRVRSSQPCPMRYGARGVCAVAVFLDDSRVLAGGGGRFGRGAPRPAQNAPESNPALHTPQTVATYAVVLVTGYDSTGFGQ